MTGAKFLDLKEEDLERMEINLKWRSMIMKAVGMLRRETLRASRIDEVNWEDGYDADKDGPLPSPPRVSTDDDLSASGHHSTSASTETDPAPSQEHSSLSKTDVHDDLEAVVSRQRQETDIPEHRRGIVEDITGVLLSWKKEQEDKAKKITPIGGLGFIEGVVIGGVIVAFMMRFSR
ncbi:hypothetical protein BGX34_006895 [Mortierella sp. NVP85]|nr:hypothetical protein BGX34_006895 [Mortierella sp. NVP85]